MNKHFYKMRKYPVGIQSFESLRKGGYLYIDKTELIYRLVSTGKYYFFSRPRRFGKSLLISTLEAYYSGRKELFQGLFIYKVEKDWNSYPILHFDLNAQKYDSPESLNDILNDILVKWEKIYGTEPSEVSLSLRFQGIIQRAAEKTGKNVVILVDEYDKPMLQAIGNNDLQNAYRDTLKAFYGALKSKDQYIQFALLTGVTKFSKVSIFSDLNNLMDISFDKRYSELCGITENEIHTWLEEDLHELSINTNMSYDQVCKCLKERYDGYHFTEDSNGLYNPFSLLNTFARMKFGNYWFETGTPSYLAQLLKQNKCNLTRLSNEVATSDLLNGVDTLINSPIPVLYQSGYLTIKSYNSRFNVYTLGFPNKEVEEGFISYLLPYYAHVQPAESAFQIMSFIEEVEKGEIEAFFLRLQSFFADTPYEMIRDLELHYQNVLFILFKLLGFYTEVEYHTSEGRIDLLIKTNRFIYLMEFKLEGTAEEALAQINEKHYATPFQVDRRKVFKIGVNFSNKTRNIQKWIVEEV